jgi:hypothetical protein
MASRKHTQADLDTFVAVLNEAGLSTDSPPETVWAIYRNSGDILYGREGRGKEKASAEMRGQLKLLRQAILAIWPDIRFDPDTRKLRDTGTKRQYTLIIDDARGRRVICFPEVGTSPTIYAYPDRVANTRTAPEVIALLAQQDLIAPTANIVQADSVSTVEDYLRRTVTRES